MSDLTSQEISLSPGTVLTDDQAADLRRLFFLPGEQVRRDPAKKIHSNVYSDDELQRLEQNAIALGGDALTVSQTYAHKNLDQPHILVSYQFEGKDGLHPANLFIDHRGERSEYGVFSVIDEQRLFFTPLKWDGDDTILPNGPAREILGITGRLADDIVREGFDAFKETILASEKPDLNERGTTGELLLVSRQHGEDASKPAYIAAIPWMSSASEAELDIASQRVDMALKLEEIERGPKLQSPLGKMQQLVQGSGTRVDDGQAKLGEPGGIIRRGDRIIGTWDVDVHSKVTVKLAPDRAEPLVQAMSAVQRDIAAFQAQANVGETLAPESRL